MLLIRSMFLTLAAFLCLCFSTRAHICGVRELEVPLGSTAIWTIDADMEEVQSLYTPVDLGDSTIAIITPGRQFLAHDAYFAIYGKKEGTTTFSYQWFYAGTGFGGTCTVTVTVKPPSLFTGISSYTAMSGVYFFLYSQYLFSQRYVFTPQTMPPGVQYNPETGQFFWIPNPVGFYIMTGLWSLAPTPTETFPLISHFLVSPRSALRLDLDLKHSSKVELCIGNPLGGPITLERTTNLRDWIAVATYDSAPEREIRKPIGALATAIYRTRLGAPTLQFGAEPGYFKFPIPENFAADSRLYWSVATDDAGPSNFEGPLSSYNGRFVLPLDPQNLPSRGNIYFTIQDALRTTAVMNQPFEKINGPPVNAAPVITGLPETIILPRNGQPLRYRFNVTDDRTFPNVLEFHPMSMNPLLVPEFRIQADIDSDGSGTLHISATPNQTGTAPIELTFFDGSLISTQAITVETAVETPPNISRIPDVYTPINAETRVIDFTVYDAETVGSALTLSIASSDPSVIPTTNIVINVSDTNRTLVITPAQDATGSSTITITVSDAVDAADQSEFEVRVVPTLRNYYDFNWDMKTDLILQDDTGSMAAWYMNGSARIGEAPLDPPTTGTKDWLCIGAGFFDGDRRGDLLYQYTDGTLATWHLEGVGMKFGNFLSPQKSEAGYRAVAVTDLNRDRESDILYQDADGKISAWLMNGIEWRSTITFATQPADNTWKLVGAGDFNSDAYSDFVFQKDNGTLELWYMKVGARLGVATFNPSQPDDPEERVVAVTDLNNDGKTDLLHQKPTGGPIRAWYMIGIERTLSEPLGAQPSGTWRVVGP